MFSTSDLKQISDRGMSLQTVEKQIGHFIQGFPFIELVRPATSGDGIISAGAEEKSLLSGYYDQNAAALEVVKFVPASGAASRMFKHLFEFREKYSPGPAGLDVFEKDKSFGSVWYFINHLNQIAFYNELSLKLERNGLSLGELLERKDFGTVVDYVLKAPGLDYANLPKGLIRFHDYPGGARTSAEEHMVEAGLYAKDASGRARLHFTISPEHRSRFESLVQNVSRIYESMLGVSLSISFSVQSPSTDTIAVGEDNLPFRNPDGSLLFRPGGHGALLQNLQDIDADLVFIKNIDNIVPDRLKEATVLNKKAIGGLLLQLRSEIFGFLRKADEGRAGAEEVSRMAEFCVNRLGLPLPEDFGSADLHSRIAWLRQRLDRPVRICGMVKNEGEPGGGPYWVRNGKGEVSLQIVESSQVDSCNEEQMNIFRTATHFNPVDLVCLTRNYKGEKFDLQQFVDEETGFISVKSSGGRQLKALERPGLWNGAMAEWITLFFEVPIITFNPVKTVNDLLRKEHLPE